MTDGKRAGALVVGWFLFIAAAAVQAEEQSGFYIGGSIGHTRHDIDPTSFLVSIGPFDDGVEVQHFLFDVDDGELGWSGTLGYRINSYFAAELAYMDFGDADVSQQYRYPFFTIWPVPPIIRDASVSVHGPALTALASLPIGPVRIFLRGGVLFADEKLELNGNTPGSDANTFASEVLLAGAGLDWTFAERWAARIEYQRTGDLDRNVIIGENKLEHVSLSVLYRL